MLVLFDISKKDMELIIELWRDANEDGGIEV
jgi:hypothetical protein